MLGLMHAALKEASEIAAEIALQQARVQGAGQRSRGQGAGASEEGQAAAEDEGAGYRARDETPPPHGFASHHAEMSEVQGTGYRRHHAEMSEVLSTLTAQQQLSLLFWLDRCACTLHPVPCTPQLPTCHP